MATKFHFARLSRRHIINAIVSFIFIFRMRTVCARARYNMDSAYTRV